FHGGQVSVIGRYSGSGPVAIKLTGQIGKETKEFVYELAFSPKSSDDKAFVEDLWARRKVGFLLAQIRQNGEKKELGDEVVTLAKKYGIGTPYTRYLVVPDSVAPVVNMGPGRPMPRPEGAPAPVPPALRLGQGGGQPAPGSVAGLAKDLDRAKA